jgi:glycosyltransferase involved in cell wall biosynthesis|tara:strand:- start:14354 stop:15292 length:939 start_codon:yes stop_codon:yes gene_type:complete
MKIYINRQPVEGPWGGGNKTLGALCSKIIEKGHDLVYDLQPEIDLIFCYDPRPDNTGVWYQDFINYKANHPKTKILQRVGDVGTHSKPELTKLLRNIIDIKTTDFFIFPSQWSKNYLNYNQKNFKVIENKPLSTFYKKRRKSSIGNKIRVVTHHWSTNEKKGFDIYSELGSILQTKKIAGKEVELTYIGRYNKKFSSEGWSLVDPIDVSTLSEVLPKHDVYLTASIEEAGANHVLESLACGLPVLYRTNGGSINEYCKNYGLEYNDTQSLLDNLEIMIKDYEIHKSRVTKYTDKMEMSIAEYVDCIENLLRK